MAKILLIEDDEELCHTVRDWFERENHTLEFVRTGREGEERIKYYRYDLLILDLWLPDMDGIEVLKRMRERGEGTPVLLLTGRTTVDDKLQGLDTGADDYMCKPFDARELSARVRALLRRPEASVSTLIRVGDLTIDPANTRVTKCGKELNLLPREYALLEFFARHPGQVFSAEAIMERVWASDSEASTDVVRVHLARLRSKIDVKGEPSWITTKRGIGYKFEPPPEACN